MEPQRSQSTPRRTRLGTLFLAFLFCFLNGAPEAPAQAPAALRLGNGISQASFERLGGAREFRRRRVELAKSAADGGILLYSASAPREGYRLRQDNDFFYFTGIGDMNALLWIEGRSARSILFETPQVAREVRTYGMTALSVPDAATRFGFDAVMPLEKLQEVVQQFVAGGGERPPALYLRLSPPDRVDGARMETGWDNSRRKSGPWDGSLSREAQIERLLRERFPKLEIRNLTPAIDAMRAVKTPGEIEILRRNGRISAEGIAAGIAQAAPGTYEYEVEAAATLVFLKNGAQGNAYPAIVGSGPNGNIWHYFRNDRRMEAGDLVVFDFGADLDQLTMDITRTFPVSGKFSEEQRKWYELDVRAQEAMIAAMRPGMKLAEITAIGRRIFDEVGIGNQMGSFPGHGVGLATHDVGPDRNAELKPGHVLTCEPIIEFPEKNLHIRIEDTILITPAGHEVLSSGVPKKAAEIEKLVGSARQR